MRRALARLRVLGSYGFSRCLRCRSKLPRPADPEASEIRCPGCGEVYRARYAPWDRYRYGMRLRDATAAQMQMLEGRLNAAWFLLAVLALALVLAAMCSAAP